MSRRILITGGTGFFGKSILDYHQRHNLGELTILSRSASVFTKLHSDLSEGVHFVDGDVRSFDVGNEKYDVVIHAATPARVDVSDDEMRSTIIDGTSNAIEQAKKCNASKFMMVSSGGVYGQGYLRPISEEDTPCPCTTYGIAKLEAEKMAVDSGLYTLLPRCFAFVGKYLPQDAHFAIGNFIRDSTIGHDIIIQGDGTPIRSYLYADDLVEWLFAILERAESGRPYNVGSDEQISIRDLAYKVNNALDGTSEIRVLGAAVPGAANCYIPVVDRAKSELNVKIRVALDEAIRSSMQRKA